MKLEHKVEGFDEFAKLLSQLPPRVEHRVLQKATRETLVDTVLKPLKMAAPRHKGKRSQASMQYGTLLSNIRVAAVRKKKKGERGAIVSTGRGFWGYIIEKGSRYIPANPWFAPTFRAHRRNIEQTLGEKLGQGIEDEAARIYRGKR